MYSSISDEKNNIHWLRATTDAAFTYDVLATTAITERRGGRKSLPAVRI